MNNKFFWNHIGKYFNTYIGTIILFIAINVLAYNLIVGYNETLSEEQSSLKDAIYEAYRIDPTILDFNEDNVAILKLDVLLLGVSNSKENIQLSNSSYTDDFDECVGYIILKKQDSTQKIDIDESHICDMIDY